MKALEISKDLSLPLDFITMRTVEYGDSGSGKTAFARLVAERVHAAGHRFCAIDLKNDWWGLKSSADGAAAGIPVVVFGGPRADVKLYEDPAAAAALADTVAEIDQPAIIDLDALSRAKQERFLHRFLDRLYEANRRPLLLICDEADRYAAQKPMSQDALMALSASEDIARRGRKRGIGSMWLTQRTAVLNKNVSEFGNLTVVFRTPGERDLKELEDRVGRIAGKDVVREVMRAAPGLADGEAFFLSAHPKLRAFMPDPVRPVQLPMPWTFDSSATPGVGGRRREPKVLAETDLAAIEARMATQVEQAAQNDPAELRRRLARAQAEAREWKDRAERTRPDAVKVKTERVEVPAMTARDAQAIDRAAGQLERVAEILSDVKAKWNDLAEGIHGRLEGFLLDADVAGLRPEPAAPRLEWHQAGGGVQHVVRSQPYAGRGAVQATGPAPGRNGGATASDGSGPSLKAGARRMLSVLAQMLPATLTEGQWSGLCKMTMTGGTWKEYVRSLTAAGLVGLTPDGPRITETGVKYLGASVPPGPRDSTEAVALWASKLKGGAARMLVELVKAWPMGVSDADLGERCGFEVGGGTFKEYKRMLLRNRLADPFTLTGGAPALSANSTTLLLESGRPDLSRSGV